MPCDRANAGFRWGNRFMTRKQTDLASGALRAFFRIAALWSLSSSEQMAVLGADDMETLTVWRKGDHQHLSSDTLERLSLLLGIFKALNQLLPPKQADAWMRRPNSHPLFQGQPAIQLASTGKLDDLRAVRRYLDGQLA